MAFTNRKLSLLERLAHQVRLLRFRLGLRLRVWKAFRHPERFADFIRHRQETWRSAKWLRHFVSLDREERRQLLQDEAYHRTGVNQAPLSQRTVYGVSDVHGMLLTEMHATCPACAMAQIQPNRFRVADCHLEPLNGHGQPATRFLVFCPTCHTPAHINTNKPAEVVEPYGHIIDLEKI